MKKIMSVIMVAIMAICGTAIFTSCGDDEETFETLPTVVTEECVVNGNNADVTGKITWNDNKSSRNVMFRSWKSGNENDYQEWSSKLSDNNVYTTVTGRINFTASSAGNTIDIYKKGETVYYQVIVKDVKYKGGTQDVKGAPKSFIVQ